MIVKKTGALLLALGVVFFLVFVFGSLPRRCAAQTAAGQVVAELKPLPGGLNGVPVLNSNSPEVIEKAGILVSSLPKEGKAHPEAHLGFAFDGRFDIFAHHIARGRNSQSATLYMAIVLFNAGARDITVDVLQAGSYLSQPDAPFIDLPAWLSNDQGCAYSGPGDRLSADFLRGLCQPGWPSQVVVRARQSAVLACLPVPVSDLSPPINGRSTLIKLRAHGKVYAATLALFGKRNADGSTCPPFDAEWRDLLQRGELAGPRKTPPSPPQAPGPVSYGRVAGVSIGDRWDGQLSELDCTGQSQRQTLVSHMVSYPVSTVIAATLGTGQVQSAAMAVREPGSAYAAHGNYAVLYSLRAPLLNKSQAPVTVAVRLSTPLKDTGKNGEPQYLQQPSGKPFFRGTIKISYVDDSGADCQHYVHLVERLGEKGKPLAVLHLAPGRRRSVNVSWLYPPDATPPQALSLECSPDAH